MNREQFDTFIYSSLDEAILELDKRKDDDRLTEYIKKSLPAGVPTIMKGKKNFVLFRHLATSNYEINRFAMVADSFPQFTPLVLEYTDDSFNDINEFKYYLGKLRFHKGFNKNGEAMIEHVSVIDFTKSNKKPISSLQTLWGEGFVDFHHRLFHNSFPQLKDSLFDLSAWLRGIAPDARDYYKSFLTLFLKDAILFENFIPDGKESSFTQDIILPAICEIHAESGVKPLIVALEPTEIEGDDFWHSHPHKTKKLLHQQL